MFSDINEGLLRMHNDPVVIHVNKGILTSSFKMYPWITQRVEVFGNEGSGEDYGNTILSKNSPLTPVFRFGLLKMRESGGLDRLRIEWEGAAVPKGDSQSKEVRVISMIGISCNTRSTTKTAVEHRNISFARYDHFWLLYTLWREFLCPNFYLMCNIIMVLRHSRA